MSVGRVLFAGHGVAGFNPDFWPAGTTVSEGEVCVSGLPLSLLVEAWGTPSVHSAPALIPATAGRASTGRWTAVLVVRITALEHLGRKILAVETDARLDNLRLIWSEARLLNRPSRAKYVLVLIARHSPRPAAHPSDDVLAVQWPADLEIGDLLVIPSRSIRTTPALHPHPLTGTDVGIPQARWSPDPSQ